MLNLDMNIVDLPFGLLRAVKPAPWPQKRGRRSGDYLNTQMRLLVKAETDTRAKLKNKKKSMLTNP